jgi:hypothetical protein
MRFYKLNRASTLGSIHELEHSTTVNNAQAAYVGMSYGLDEILTAMCRAMIRQLFIKAGHSIPNMNAKVQGPTSTWLSSPGRITLHYSTAGTAVQIQPFVVSADDTYNDVAAQLIIWFENTFDPAGLAYTFQSIEWFNQLGGGVTDNLAANATLQLSGSFIDITFSGKMHVQNQTLAAGVGDESNSLDVAANPLIGKVYFGRGNELRTSRVLSSSTVVSGLADANHGLITFNQTGMVGDMGFAYNRPPGASGFMSVKNCKPLSLAPGQIKTFYTSFKKHISFNQMMSLIDPYLSKLDGLPVRTGFGGFVAVGLHKKCKISGDPNNNLGVEINAKYTCVFSERRPSLARDVQIV